jgi:ubiquinone/menaquinone biosynthesis C-methylase UbiE
MRRILRPLAATAVVWLALRAWAAIHATAFPYFARSILEVPRPLITRRRLVAILAEAAGERIVEVGPGTGYYTLPVAARLGPTGTLEILDTRQRYLDHTSRRAQAAGLTNVTATLGDGAALPFPDGWFDAAYLVTVLGEIRDPQAALDELRRVRKPQGRLVVGEIFIEPDFPTFGRLVEHAAAAGLELDCRIGGPLGYFARFSHVGQR